MTKSIFFSNSIYNSSSWVYLAFIFYFFKLNPSLFQLFVLKLFDLVLTDVFNLTIEPFFIASHNECSKFTPSLFADRLEVSEYIWCNVVWEWWWLFAQSVKKLLIRKDWANITLFNQSFILSFELFPDNDSLSWRNRLSLIHRLFKEQFLLEHMVWISLELIDMISIEIQVKVVMGFQNLYDWRLLMILGQIS